MIRYSMPQGEEGRASLAIFDVAGRRVRELWHGRARSAGFVNWDGLDAAGRPVPTGIYFARWETAAGTSSARVIRIR